MVLELLSIKYSWLISCFILLLCISANIDLEEFEALLLSSSQAFSLPAEGSENRRKLVHFCDDLSVESVSFFLTPEVAFYSRFTQCWIKILVVVSRPVPPLFLYFLCRDVEILSFRMSEMHICYWCKLYFDFCLVHRLPFLGRDHLDRFLLSIFLQLQ